MKKILLFAIALVSIGISAQKKSATKHTVKKKTTVTKAKPIIKEQPMPNTGDEDYLLSPAPKLAENTGNNENSIVEKVDQWAEFPGGINMFRHKIADEFDVSILDSSEGLMKTEIIFVIEKDGSITDIRAIGSNSEVNKEAIRVVKSIKTKWKPAISGGRTVRSRFRLPFSVGM